MDSSFDLLFNKNLPDQLESLLDFVNDLYEELKEGNISVKWTRKRDFSEYGFNIVSADKTKTLFVGIWLDIWKFSGKPFCLALDWSNPEDNGIAYLIKDVRTKLVPLEVDYLEYDDWPTLVFGGNLFTSESSAKDFLPIIKQVTDRLQFNLYFNK
ncbi:MAG: hypothetical protein ACTHJN_03090 [Ginsengibacter sp.]